MKGPVRFAGAMGRPVPAPALLPPHGANRVRGRRPALPRRRSAGPGGGRGAPRRGAARARRRRRGIRRVTAVNGMAVAITTRPYPVTRKPTDGSDTPRPCAICGSSPTGRASTVANANSASASPATATTARPRDTRPGAVASASASVESAPMVTTSPLALFAHPAEARSRTCARTGSTGSDAPEKTSRFLSCQDRNISDIARRTAGEHQGRDPAPRHRPGRDDPPARSRRRRRDEPSGQGS